MKGGISVIPPRSYSEGYFFPAFGIKKRAAGREPVVVSSLATVMPELDVHYYFGDSRPKARALAPAWARLWTPSLP